MTGITRSALCLVASCLLTAIATRTATAQAEELPALKVESVRRVFHNGEHNAFTDMVRFRDKLWLTFRSCPDGHSVNPTSSIIVLSSDDGQQWQQVHRFRVAKRDCRDPHFLVFKDRLFVYSGAWYCGDGPPKHYEMNEHLGFAVWTGDGQKWHGPIMLEGTYGHYIWRAATHGGKAYLCARRKRHFAKTGSREEREPLVQSAMLESDDGLIWRTVGFFQERYGNETAFLFKKDGSVLAVARGAGHRNAQVCQAKPPYQDWQRVDLDRYLGGPLVVRWGAHTLVGGRDITSGKPVTTLYWLLDNRLHKCAQLPSGGDNSYPGFLQLSEQRALISYYSSHERDATGKTITAIYLADLRQK